MDRLSPELYELILLNMDHSDYHSLKKMAQVASQFLYPARKLLFQKISLQHPNAETRAESLLPFLSKVVHYINVLSLDVSDEEIRCTSLQKALEQIIDKSFLRRIELQARCYSVEAPIPSMDSLLSLLKAPYLEELAIDTFFLLGIEPFFECARDQLQDEKTKLCHLSYAGLDAQFSVQSSPTRQLCIPVTYAPHPNRSAGYVGVMFEWLTDLRFCIEPSDYNTFFNDFHLGLFPNLLSLQITTLENILSLGRERGPLALFHEPCRSDVNFISFHVKLAFHDISYVIRNLEQPCPPVDVFSDRLRFPFLKTVKMAVHFRLEVNKSDPQVDFLPLYDLLKSKAEAVFPPRLSLPYCPETEVQISVDCGHPQMIYIVNLPP